MFSVGYEQKFYIQFESFKFSNYLLRFNFIVFLARSHNYLLIYLLTYLITYLLTYILTYLPTYLITYLLTYLLTQSLTPYSTVLLEKLTGSHLVKKFPAFYGTRRFITAFASARHMSISWASSIHFLPKQDSTLNLQKIITNLKRSICTNTIWIGNESHSSLAF